ncbi:hypothetical protein C5167_048371 [Papaver somniferum]|uniref:PCI domain-containing protein n=1 Tax=Papaver somniferum TaxID=3469 RepID=A0A4Y7KJ61_PAPSO|nr:hypothetical protein C5167_048371 [Papaver somniferum]
MEGDDETTSVTMIDDEIYSNGGGEDKRSKPNLSSELLDVEVYAGLYSGRTKITRLMFVADRCGNQVMNLDALRMAYDEIKKGENTNLFKEVVEKIDGKLGSEYCLDQSWVDSVDRKAEVRKEKLEKSIRMGYNDFGDFYYSHGHLGDAFKNYTHTCDYCTTSKHILQMCLNAILVCIEMGQFSLAASYASMAEQTTEANDPVILAKLCCVAGLAHLENKTYKLAAGKFLETSPELGSTYAEVIAPQDVATYGGLCALASFDKAELTAYNLNFQTFLEQVPEVREIINGFHSSRYASCLEFLENLKANLLLDIHLHDNVETLYSQIRHKALIQYTHPFVCVDLRVMADAFKTDVSALENELVPLISEYQNQLRSQSSAASIEVEKCAKLSVYYEEATAKFSSSQRSTILKLEIANASAILKDAKMLDVKQKRAVQGKMACLSDQVQVLKSHVHDVDEYKSKSELESLLKAANSEYDKAVKARRIAKKAADAALAKKFTTDMQRSTILKLEIANASAILKDAKMLDVKQKRAVQGKMACLSDQVQVLKSHVHDVDEYKSKSELESLLKAANSEYDKAVKARRIAKKAADAALAKIFTTDMQDPNAIMYVTRNGQKVAV